MLKTNRIASLALICLTLVPASLFAAGGPARSATAGWLNIQVTDNGNEDVNLRLPLAFAELALQALDDKDAASGRIRVNGADFSLEEVRRVWRALNDAGDSKLATVEDGDTVLNISVEKESVFLTAQSRNSGRRELQARLSAGVVDALLSGRGDELNLKAALEELRYARQGDILELDDDDSHVRIWIE